MRVLIVSILPVNTVVHSSYVLEYLHAVAPSIEIDWVVEEANSSLLDGNRLVAQIHVVNTERWRRNLFARATRKEIIALRKTLRERHYDLVFDLQGNLASGLVAFFSGCERRYGFDRDGVDEPLNSLFSNNQVPLRRQDNHSVSRNLRVVSVPFGKEYATVPLKTDIYTSSDDDGEAAALLATLADGLVFLIHQGGCWETTMWYEAGWRELIAAIIARNPHSTVLLSWENEKEKEAVDRIAVGMAGVRILPALTLKGLTALIKKVDLVIGGDAGPVHIAAAVGTPTVSFYRATDHFRNAPRGDMHRNVVLTLVCRGCLENQCTDETRCRESITPERMLKAVESLVDSGFVSG